jgi:multiple sugar transport system permease protein
VTETIQRTSTSSTAGTGGASRHGHRLDRTPASTIIVTAVLVVVALYFLVPLYWVVIAATKTTEDLFATSGFWFGNTFNLFENLRMVFTYDGGIFLRWLGNSLLYSGVGGVLATYFAAAGGYALAMYDFRGRNVVFATVLGGVLVPTTATALPLFLLFSELGLTNTYWSVLIPSLVSPFGLFLCRVYAHAAIDSSLLESGRLDGAGELRIFHTLALRPMMPVLVTVFLFQAVTIWNNFFLPLIMLGDQSLYPLTLGIDNWRAQTDRLPEFYQLTTGGVLVSVIPLVIAVIVLQRFWRGGLTEGSVKG